MRFFGYTTEQIKFTKFYNAPEARVPEFLVAKLRELTKLRHVRPSVRYNSAPIGRIFMKFGI